MISKFPFIFLITSMVAPVYGNSILYIGDSQSYGHFGTLMYPFLMNYPQSCTSSKANKKNKVDFHAVHSSSYFTWNGAVLKGGKKSWICGNRERTFKYGISKKRRIKCSKPVQNRIELLLKKKPDMMVFQLMGNSQKKPLNDIKKDLRKFLKNLPKDKPCVFIASMPYLDSAKSNRIRKIGEDNVVKALEALGVGGAPRCHVIRNMTEENLEGFAKNKENYRYIIKKSKRDPMHYSRRGAKKYFEIVKNQFCSRKLLQQQLLENFATEEVKN